MPFLIWRSGLPHFYSGMVPRFPWNTRLFPCLFLGSHLLAYFLIWHDPFLMLNQSPSHAPLSATTICLCSSGPYIAFTLLIRCTLSCSCTSWVLLGLGPGCVHAWHCLLLSLFESSALAAFFITSLLLSTTFMSSSKNYAFNWVPTLNGVAVAGNPLIEKLQDICLSPANPKEKAWSNPSNKKHLETHPVSAEAIFEAILMLWRLQCVIVHLFMILFFPFYFLFFPSTQLPYLHFVFHTLTTHDKTTKHDNIGTSGLAVWGGL